MKGVWCVCCGVPVFGLGLAPCVVLLFLSLSWSSCIAPPFQCVCCYSIVDLGVCLCDRVVSLWNGGGGLCLVEERWCACVVFSSLSLLFSSSLLFGVRGSARAALRARTLSPNTIASSCCLSSSPLFLCPPFFCVPPFFLLEWRWVCSPCVGVLGGHDCDG